MCNNSDRRHLVQHAFGTNPLEQVESDKELIRRYSALRDDRAFSMLVDRYGALVWGVVLRMLRHRQDAEDAFQATFLVFASRARSWSDRHSLAAWLHGIAVHVCHNHQRAERRRRKRIQDAASMARNEYEVERRDALRAVVDQELATLPLRYREVLVMCDIEGFTKAEAAERLSLPMGTVSSRLSRGRERLKSRLLRQGVMATAGVTSLLTTLHAEAASTLPATLLESTVRNADVFAWGTAAAKASMSLQITQLADGVLRTMMIARCKTFFCLVAIVATSLFGGAMAPGIFPESLPAATAGTVFIDDFEDGLPDDGNPVKWKVGNGATMTVENGSLGVSGTLNPYVIAEGISRSNVSMRTQARLFNGKYLVVGVRSTQDNAYDAAIGTPDAPLPNEASIFTTGSGLEELALTTHALDLQQDVVIQLDAIGNTIALYAWQAGGPIPTAPLLSVTDSQIDAGSVSLLVTDNVDSPGSARAAFRYVHVADEHIPLPAIPEPGSREICVIGSGLLLVGLLTGQRMRRRSAIH